MTHIVWAEDDASDRMFIQAVLRDIPGRPTTEFVRDGEELLRRLDACQPDLVVLDLGLPGVGGLEILALLNQRPFRVPILVFSGAQGAETHAACLKLGAQQFIRKPADFRDYRTAVERIINPQHAMLAA